MSTDPASNLDAVLDTELANAPRPVHGVPGLLAMNINPDQAAREYRSRTLAPYRSTASPAEFALLEERLSGACTVEVAAFDEFTLLLTRRRPDRCSGARDLRHRPYWPHVAPVATARRVDRFSGNRHCRGVLYWPAVRIKGATRALRRDGPRPGRRGADLARARGAPGIASRCWRRRAPARNWPPSE